MKQHIFNPLKTTHRKRRSVSFVVSLCFVWLAASSPALSRPVADDPPPNTRGRSAGSRGCSTETASASSQNTTLPALVLLAPEGATAEGLGQMISTQPTFAWFRRDYNNTVQTVFRLYEYNTTAQTYELLVESQNIGEPEGPGIVIASLADEMATLAVGSRYLWQVGLLCEPNSPSGDLFAETEFEVVAPSETLASQLAAASDAKKAELLTTENLWYDALPLVFSNEPLATGDADIISATRQALLTQVTFSVEEQTQLENSPFFIIELTD